MTSKEIHLNNIDTKVAASNYTHYLDGNKTYFLNGDWGSGKTTFLNQISETSKKKMITLNFWEIKDERTAMEIGFSRIHPWLYYLSRSIFIISVIISLLMTEIINLGISNWIKESNYTIIGVVGLFIALYNFFKPKNDSIYYTFFNCLHKLFGKTRTKKVVVIDDFDRISVERQEDIYKLFNTIKGHYPIIFVGDFNKIIKNDSSYLLKIIDYKLELPINLNPDKIWDFYIQEIESKLNITFPTDLKNMIIREQKNLRDRDHFNNYVNLHFISNKKYLHVHADQQLWIIYLYLFHPRHYNHLFYGVDSIISEDLEGSILMENFAASKKSREKFNLVTVESEKIDDYFALLIHQFKNEDRDVYPDSFNRGKWMYFINESPLNMTITEIEQIIDDTERLKQELLNDYNSDLFRYLNKHYNSLSSVRKDNLFTISMQLTKENKESDILKFVITSKSSELTSTGIEDKEFINFWNDILNTYEFEFSQKFHFFVKLLYISFDALQDYFSNIKLSKITPKQPYPEYVLLVYFSINDLWENNTWSSNKEIVELVGSFSSNSFLEFCCRIGLMEKDINIQNSYIVWKKKYTYYPPHNLIDNEETLKKFTLKIDELSMRKKIHFSYKENER